MTPSEQIPSGTARPFFDTAREIRHGEFLDECADALQSLVADVSAAGKAGKLVIELTVSPASKKQGAMKLADKITIKSPVLPAGETILFVTPENNLVPNDPRQIALDLRVAPAPSQALKTA